jgi:RNA polymerase sigma-70 factor (ECF subfamily)
MGFTMLDDEPRRDHDLLIRIEAGDEQAMTDLFTRHRERLRQTIRLRLDRRLQGRIDSSDILQDAYFEIARRARAYVNDPDLPPFIWLRFLTVQTLRAVHRKHLKLHTPDAGHEVSLHHGAPLPANSASLAELLLGRLTSPSHAAQRAEMQLILQEALNAMKPVDREILALRHFEELSNGEAALVLRLTKTATSNRYIRALGRLKEILSGMPGVLGD